jgi:hypothetical protein
LRYAKKKYPPKLGKDKDLVDISKDILELSLYIFFYFFCVVAFDFVLVLNEYSLLELLGFSVILKKKLLKDYMPIHKINLLGLQEIKLESLPTRILIFLSKSIFQETI